MGCCKDEIESGSFNRSLRHPTFIHPSYIQQSSTSRNVGMNGWCRASLTTLITGVGGFRSAATFTIRRSIGFKSNKLILIFLKNKRQRSSPANALRDDPRLIGAPNGIHSV